MARMLKRYALSVLVGVGSRSMRLGFHSAIQKITDHARALEASTTTADEFFTVEG